MQKLMSAEQFPTVIEGLASRIDKSGFDTDQLAFIGIRTRGVPLAERLAQAYSKLKDKPFPVGELDINFYRDDLSQSADDPIFKKSDLGFDLNDKTVLLCDDVLYTGRTVRAAMDAVFDLGRPKAVYLVVMARRNGRELPVDANLFALDVKTNAGDNVKVKFLETDQEDSITLLEEGDY